MKLRARTLALALCIPTLAGASILATPSVALAQDDPMIKMARERFQEGVKYYDQKRYEEARAAFLQAYALKKHPAVLLNLAQSEVRSGHDADAAKHFAQFLRDNTEATAAEKKDADGGLAMAKARIEEVKLAVDQAGAEVFVDGQSEGFAPLPGPVYLMPGSHTLEARKGGKTTSQTVSATAGSSATVNLSFAGGGATPAGVAPPAGAGTPSDGAGGDGLPPPMQGSPANGDANAGAGVSMDTGGKREPFISWAKHTPLAWVGGGVTVVGLGAGIGFAIGSSSSYSKANDVAAAIVQHANTDPAVSNTAGLCNHPPPDYVAACAKYQDDRDSGDSQKTIATVSFVLAGAAAAGTVIYYFVDSKPKKASTGSAERHGFRAGIVPVAAPTVQGLQVFGEF